MARKLRGETCCEGTEAPGSCCRVEALIGVDERGQMVLPKDLRERAGIRPGDKLVLVSWSRDGEICCMSLVKAEELVDMVKDRLGPMMAEIL